MNLFLVAKSNYIRGFVRPWVRPSVGPLVRRSVARFSKIANLSKFDKIRQNSWLFAAVGQVTALFICKKQLYKEPCPAFLNNREFK